MSARLIPYQTGAPAWNMAADEALLRLAAQPTLRFYGWEPPAVSLGHFQRRAVDLAPFRAAGLPIVRRLTGGGAIVHWHELTYSLVLPLDHPVLGGTDARGSYGVLHAPLLDALRRLGVHAVARGPDAMPESGPGPFLCFHRVTSLDLVAGGRKLLGSAQRRSGGRLLQHGSLILAPNALQAGTASLSELLGHRVEAGDVWPQAAASFAALLGPLDPGGLTAEEAALAEELAPGTVV